MWAISAIAAVTLAILSHAALSRLVRVPGNMVARFLVPGFLWGAVLGVWLALVGRVAPIESLAGLLGYAGVCELYLFLFTLVSSSISSQLLLRLSSATTPMTQAAAFASEDEMVLDRLKTLLANGLLIETSAGYDLTPRGDRLLRTFDRLRSIFRHTTGISSAERTAPHPTHPR